MKTIIRTSLIAGFTLFTGFSAQALTTQEIVNQAMPSVVAIVYSNSKTGAAAEGTGWFITPHRIVTNSHVASADGFDGLSIINVGTGQEYHVDHTSYNNVATDLAVITVTEANPAYLTLSTLTMKPIEGMPVVIIGNPKNQYGKVTEGKMGETFNGAPTKKESGSIVFCTVIGGNSGSPVLDANGDVVGMIWGTNDNNTVGYAVNIQTLTLARVESIEIGAVVQRQQQPQPQVTHAQVEATQPGLIVPTKFGTTHYVNGYALTPLLYDEEVYRAIAGPAVWYLQRSAKGEGFAELFMTQLSVYYDDSNIPFTEAWRQQVAYNAKWPHQVNTIDYANMAIEQMTGQNIKEPLYVVSIPFTWVVKNAKGKTRTGKNVLTAMVVAGVHTNNNEPAYFISGVWNAKT